MHYYVDGYNLLFRVLGPIDSITDQRVGLISELNNLIAPLDINVTLVFDSQHQPGESIRSHFQHLEIVYTALGETADECILNEVQSDPNPKQVTVVTSDRKLAWYARRCSAKTETVEKFISWLRKRHKNKLRQKVAVPKPKIKKEQAAKTLEPAMPVKPVLPEGSLEYYLERFEALDRELSEVKMKQRAAKVQKRKEAKKKRR